ncbi:hypothetical protein Scep_001887 [Stephania cephalantha]|uniref:Uncharacterized protein n=1 Tax=Stephania cephalantha TaxID=152367 RepID=A0AAP0L994_9MAGN
MMNDSDALKLVEFFQRARAWWYWAITSEIVMQLVFDYDMYIYLCFFGFLGLVDHLYMYMNYCCTYSPLLYTWYFLPGFPLFRIVKYA